MPFGEGFLVKEANPEDSSLTEGEVMADNYCCLFMKGQLNYKCETHGKNCPDIVLTKSSSGNHYIVGRNATYACNYCPGCGKKT